MSGSAAWVVNGEKIPAKAKTLSSLMSFWTSALPRTGSNWSSSMRSSSLAPPAPPVSLASVRIAWTPCIMAVPTEPSGPDSGKTPPRRRGAGAVPAGPGGAGGVPGVGAAAAVRPEGAGAEPVEDGRPGGAVAPGDPAPGNPAADDPAPGDPAGPGRPGADAPAAGSEPFGAPAAASGVGAPS